MIIRLAAAALAATAFLAIDSTDAFAQCGKASWYGPGFHGRKTANGERFNQGAMTAAHRSLPFGSKVVVTNKKNGRTVVVRINDRGPFVGGRVLDVSKAAAQQLGFIGAGHTSVCMGGGKARTVEDKGYEPTKSVKAKAKKLVTAAAREPSKPRVASKSPVRVAAKSAETKVGAAAMRAGATKAALIEGPQAFEPRNAR